MLLSGKSGFVCLAALLAGCTSSSSIAAVTAVTSGPAVVASPVAAAEAESRVFVGSREFAGSDTTVQGDRLIVSARASEKWTGGFSRYMRVLSETSCPAGTQRMQGEAVQIAALPVPLQPLKPARNKVGELTFVAGFHITSSDKRFGGLSGLEVLPDGNLLAVSDSNRFVWIDLAKDGVTPVSARIANMHGLDGNPLANAVDGDAEGIAFNDGTALVSYDRNQQVLAYDIGKCGAAARGAPIVFGPFGLPLADAYGESRIAVAPDSGSEALAVTSDWYLFTGIETKVGQLSPMSARPIEQDPDFSLRVGVEAQQFVGLDVIPASRRAGSVRAFTLHRSFSPRAGYSITIAETDFNRYADDAMLTRHIDGDIDQRARVRFVETGWRKLAEIDKLMTIDNFEGIAAKEMVDGRTRLFVISDDNFSPNQRTLLMVFDMAKPAR